MKTIQHPVALTNTYPLERIAPLESILFFDIETTGFSGDISNLYLIGCTFYQKETANWHMIQWFADTKDSEPDLLTAFFTLLKGYSTLIHFNGDLFDIPYLLKRCRHYHLDYDFSQVTSIDIYRKIRPYKKLLGLKSLKQKSIEQFLGIDRTDRCSGGQLIEVYEDYLVSHDQFLYDMLILHNEDDLKGMPLILPILSYPDMLEQPSRLSARRILHPQEFSSESGLLPDTAMTDSPVLELVYENPCSVPVPFQISSSLGSLSVSGSQIICQIPLYEGELKYFYPNYKDYYYLPCEDTAIHKSVGEYVAREARIKATAKTCYTRKSGLFLPQLPDAPLWQPVFQMEYKAKIAYAAYTEALLSDPETANTYLHQLLTEAVKKES